ncbi:LLM class flavin-dependent oxidoreductase [Sphaerotilus uruguayifluvii]|uniref:Luciferase family oxidoreductase group 1 n=1 Tax=Sphaerotilus uruguayifluvii TaxID=2735897 RepID=A0ABX2FWJ8_9BURK|nr:LLM class flavin-dependent oxidoreductase [Leptothrix sp. C29]NRT54388.1 luciferase family oxidoreductase group 1 [Leptothrix sp. C29]
MIPASDPIPLSVLDLVPIAEGGDAATALTHALELARHAERCGYRRYWLAEHHNMDGLACSATAVLIAHIAAHTRTIRVGAGGIMLPNHAPLVVAEQFGTLATLHPGRIELGLGRAPGTDRATMRALRRSLDSRGEEAFPQDVAELLGYLEEARPGAQVRALPGQGTRVPVWLLGSSLYGAQLAAWLGRPYAFAAHFAPDLLEQAAELYRSTFRPSPACPRPLLMVGTQVIVADSDAAAQRLFTSTQQRFLGMVRNQRGPLPPPVDDFDALCSPQERHQVDRMLAEAIVGSPRTVRAGLRALVERTRADELILTGATFDPAARLRSLELAAGCAEPEA